MNITVVIADDFPLIREGVSAGLERDPGIHVVGTACNGTEAIELVHELRPDVLLLDLHMPEQGGMMVLERLRTEVPETRILVLTASERAETLIAAVSAGAAGYITKRSSRRELCDAVITIAGGNSVIAPQLAGHLLAQYSRASQGEIKDLRNALTAREQEVLRMAAQGMTDRDIAGQLFVSPRTVQNQLAAIRRKTGARNRSELTRWAVIHAVC